MPASPVRSLPDHRRWLLTGLLAAVATLSACGGGSDDSAPTGPSAPAPAPTDPAAPAPAPTDPPTPAPTGPPAPAPADPPAPAPAPEPAPTPLDPGDPIGARDCVDPALFVAGAETYAEYRVTGAAYNMQIVGNKMHAPAVFSGTARPEMRTTSMTRTAGRWSDATTMSHFLELGDDLVITRYGSSMSNGATPVPVITTWTMSPPMRDERFTLATVMASSSPPASQVRMQIGSLPAGTSTRQASVTFHGLETVSVPAGEFRACRFYEQVSVNDEMPTIITSWVMRGMAIKEIIRTPDGSEQTSEMTMGRVNGTAITQWPVR